MSHIALDYDHTFTVDPEGWRQFVRLFQERGHTISIVTARHDNFAEKIEDAPDGCKVYYTRRLAKRLWLAMRGIEIDIWIDDDPLHIIQDH